MTDKEKLEKETKEFIYKMQQKYPELSPDEVCQIIKDVEVRGVW